MIEMAMPNKAIFFDLDIRSDDAFSEPLEFAKRCFLKSRELSKQLSQSTGAVANREETFRLTALDNQEAAKEAAEFFNGIMDALDTMSDAAKVHLAKMMPDFGRKLASDISAGAFDMAKETVTSEVEILDKKTIHIMYVELRKAYLTYVEMACAFFDLRKEDFATIPSLTGNYSSAAHSGAAKTFIYYSFEINGQPFFSHGGVNRFIKESGIEGVPTFATRGDVIDWVIANEETSPISIVKERV